MKYLLFLLVVLFASCKKEDVPTESKTDIPTSPYITEITPNFSANASNPKVEVTDKNFVIEFDYNGTFDPPYSLNDTFMEYYDAVQHKVVPAPYPDMSGNDDLVSGHNKFIYPTDKVGFDFYNQRYTVITAYRKNNSGAVSYFWHMEFTIKRK